MFNVLETKEIFACIHERFAGKTLCISPLCIFPFPDRLKTFKGFMMAERGERVDVFKH